MLDFYVVTYFCLSKRNIKFGLVWVILQTYARGFRNSFWKSAGRNQPSSALLLFWGYRYNLGLGLACIGYPPAMFMLGTGLKGSVTAVLSPSGVSDRSMALGYNS